MQFLLALGSVIRFLEGKHFNRCKRFHLLGLEILPFKSVLDNIVVTDKMIEKIAHGRNSSVSTLIIQSQDLNYILNNYNSQRRIW